MYVVYNFVVIIIIILTFDASVPGRFLTFHVVLVDIGSGGGPHCLRIQESLAECRSSMRHRWYHAAEERSHQMLSPNTVDFGLQ
jgi:hypothetical protein